MLRTSESSLLKIAAWDRYPWLVHGFSSRHTGDFCVGTAHSEIAGAFGAPGFGVATLRQVHSDRYVRANGPWTGQPPEADTLLTRRAGILVGVRTADCFPVLLVDPVTHSVAAAHAGWRGAVAGVVPNAIGGMSDEFGVRPGDLEAAIGPGIAACCFEVGEAVAAKFGEEVVDRRQGRPHVDLSALLRHQLMRFGVRSVHSCGHCTSCAVDRYFSHRAEHGNTGRMLAAIGVREHRRT